MGGKDLVLEQAEQESMVSLIERDHELVSFCSSHILGTALPPPSGRGLRRRGPVTCGFASPRPARSRRPCAVTHGGGAARRRARARGRTPSGRRTFSSCPSSPPFVPLRMSSSDSRRTSPRLPGTGLHRGYRARRRRSGPVCSPSERSSGLRSVRARLLVRCPGSGPSDRSFGSRHGP